MQFDLTPDQRLFRDTTRDFLAAESPLSAVREWSEEPEGFPRDWWRKGVDLGWTSMLVPEELGGGSVSGNPVADLAMVAEEMGRLCSPGPLLTISAVLAGLVDGDARGHADLIGRILAGEVIASWAVYEPGHGWAPDRPDTTARTVPDGYRIDGVKDRVEAGDQADVLLVTCRTDEGLTQLMVPTDTPGVQVRPVQSLDLTRRFATVAFDGVVVPADALVGEPGAACRQVERQTRVAVALQCAESAGATAQVLEFTVRWAFDRYAFGRPLASYQALKHRFADMRTWLEACHATSAAAAEAIDRDSPSATELICVAKSYVGAKTPAIVQDCVQLHGGIGVTWEHDLHLYLRRITVNQALMGTPREHRRRLTDLLDGRTA